MNNVVPSYISSGPSRSISDDLSSGIGMASPPYISIEGQKFTVVSSDGEKEKVGGYDRNEYGLYLDICIVETNANVSRIYYGKPYDPQANQFVPPDCWSDNGIAPSTGATAPQSPTCATCHWATWGSKVNAVSGKPVPACGSYKKVAVILADSDPQCYPPGAEKMIWLLRVPPNSLKNLRSVVEIIRKNVIGNRRLEASDLIIRVYFDTDVQGTLKFQPIGYISEPMCKMRNLVWEKNAADSIVGRHDAPISSDDRRLMTKAAAREQEPAQQPPSAHPVAMAGQAPALGGGIAERAMAERPAPTPTQVERAATARPRRAAKPRAIEQQVPQRATPAPEYDHEAEEAAQDRAGATAANGSFGIVDEAPEAPGGFEDQLVGLFRR